MIDPFCELDNELPCGILPEETALLILLLAADTWAWLVNAPGPFVLPAAWHPIVAQDDWIIGLTSAIKALLVTVLQSTVKLPPPPLSLLHDQYNAVKARSPAIETIIDFIPPILRYVNINEKKIKWLPK